MQHEVLASARVYVLVKSWSMVLQIIFAIMCRLMNFKDAVREGYGEHILVLWKFDATFQGHRKEDVW